MANQKTVGIRIELNGWKGVVQNIEQFETLIKEAKEDLKQLDIGGKNFKELTTQIQNAETQLTALNEASRGFSPEKQLEGYGKLAGGITSSFAAATAAVSLFGGESEAVAEAAAQAQNLITIALSARGIQEVAVGAKIVATTIAQKAANAATLAGNAATKAFYTTLAANPYGAILAVVGLLVTAFVAFGNETEKLVSTQKNINDAMNEASESIYQQRLRIETLTDIVQDNNVSLEVRKQAYEDLKKLVPELTDLTYEEALAMGDLEVKTKAAIEALYDKALADIFAKKAAEEFANQTDINNKSIDELTTGWQSFLNNILAGVGPLRNINKILLDAADASAERERLLEISRKNEAAYQEQAAIYLRKTVEREQAAAQATETKKQAEERAKKAEENRKIGIEKLTQALKKQVDVQKALIKDLDALASAEFEVSNGIIERAEGIIERQNAILEQRGELYKTSYQKLKAELEEAFVLLVPDENERKFLVDGFYSIFNEIQEQMFTTSMAITGDIDGLINSFFGLDDTIEILGRTFTKAQFKELIPAESQQELVRYFRTFSDLVSKIEDFQTVDPTRLLNLESSVDVTESLLGLQTEYQTLLEEQEKTGMSDLAVRDKITQSIIQSFQLQSKFLPLYDETGKLINDEYGARQANNDAVNDFIDLIMKAVYNQAIFAKGVEDTNEEVQKLGKTIDENYVKQIKQIAEQGLPVLKEKFAEAFKGGVEEVDTFLMVLLSLFDDLDKIFTQEQLLGLFDEFQKALTENTDLTEEELKAFQIILDKFAGSFEEKLAGTNEKFSELSELIKGQLKDINIDEFVSDLTRAFELFSEKVGQIASLYREQASFQLEVLQKENKDALAQVVGDTAEANTKRLELTQQYETRKAQLEKEARLKSLQFTLAQSIANSAAGLLKTYAEYGFSPIGIALGLIQAGISTAEVALIGQQINYVKSLRRGGMLANGGILSGPSHENGGITFGQAGVQLEGNEAVIARGATLNYQSLLSQINQSGGGRPLVVSNPMDSRLIEVLAKERQTPIRAYVMEQDITKAQTVNRKLEQLATL